MPIRIPQTLAQGTPDLGGTPRFSTADASQPGLEAVNQALAQTAKTVTTSLQDYNKINDTLSKEDMKLDVQDKLSQVKDRLAQEDIKLREEGADPETLPDAFRQRGQAAIAEISGDLRYPQSAAKFQGDANQILGEAVIKQRYQGLKLKNARIAVNATILNDEDVNTATFGETPAIRAAALNSALDRTQSLMASDVWTQDKGSAEIASILAKVERGRARVDFQDPTKQQRVLDGLMSGRLMPHVPPEDNITLGRTLMAERTQAQRQAEDQGDKHMKRQADIFVSRAIDSWSTGNPADRMDRTAIRNGLQLFEGYVSRETQESLIKMVERPELEGGITKPEVFNNLRIQILSNPSAVDKNTILREPPENLSAKDKGDLLKMVEHQKDEKDVSQSPFYKKGREQIMILLGGTPTGLPEFLGLPILKPAEAENLARVLYQFDRKARTKEYETAPEGLVELGRKMAVAAKGAGFGTPTPTSNPTTPPASAPAVQLPKFGESPQGAKGGGSKKTVPR